MSSYLQCTTLGTAAATTAFVVADKFTFAEVSICGGKRSSLATGFPIWRPLAAAIRFQRNLVRRLMFIR